MEIMKKPHKFPSLYSSKSKKTLYDSNAIWDQTKFAEKNDFHDSDNVTSSFFIEIGEDSSEGNEFSSLACAKDSNSLKVWNNVDDLDTFLRDIYDYYKNGGYGNIMLSRLANLM